LEDIKEVKQQDRSQIESQKRELARLTQSDSTIDNQVEFCPHFFTNLPVYYQSADLILKRHIIGLIYPEKFGFKRKCNSELDPLTLGAAFSPKKKQDKRKKSVLSCLVTPSGFKPETF
jgi:hypothetical protein